MAERIFTDSLVQSVGWALVHSVWQGVLIAGGAAVLLSALRAARPTTRYAIACAALGLMLAAPVVTTLGTATEAERAAVVTLRAARGMTEAAVVPAREPGANAAGGMTVRSTRAYVERALPAAVFGWIAGVLLLSLRLATGWYGVVRLRRTAVASLPDALQARVARLSARFSISRRVRVEESAVVAVPTLVGWIHPMILLPASIVTGMPAAHIDAILAHELAHVRRHDYLVNALQAVLETLLFYHPAVWWCSRQVRIEREHCCDDLAVVAFGDRVEYATALANLEALRRGDSSLALAATDGSLLARVRRVLHVRPEHEGRSHVWVAAVSLAVVATLAMANATLTGAAREQAADPATELEQRIDATRAALIDLTARIAHWRGWLFSPAVLQFPPQPPRPPDPPVAPAPPEPPAAPLAPEPLDGPAPPAPPEPPLAPLFWPEPLPFRLEPPAPPEPPTAPLQPAPPQAPAPPAPPAVPAPPAAPAAPAPPAPPAAPAPPAIASSQGRNRMTWGNRGEQTTLEYRGSITLADDDRDLVSMSDGAYFMLSEERSRIPLLGAILGAAREIQFRGRADGTMERRYFVSGRELPYEPEGRQWLGEILPMLVRRTGFAAEQRVARILRRDGASGVARAIGVLESDFVRSRYVRLLAEQATLSTSDLNAVLQNLRISSDFDMARALMAIAATQAVDASGSAFLRAARTIGSDFELRRTLSSLLGRSRDPAFARELFAVSEDIGSDFEQASFLREAATGGLMAQAPDAFVDALANVESDVEHRRVLADALPRATGQATVRRLFQSAGRISSDHEQAEFLREAASAGLVEQGRDAFFGAAATIGSDFERRRTLAAVVEWANVPTETLEAVVRSASEIGSDFEQAELLLQIARRHRVEGPLRERMLDLAELSIASEHERVRVLSAILRSDRAAR